MDDETVQKIYKLASELASQQQSNQELALGLSNHLNEIKQKANAKHEQEDSILSITNPTSPEQRDEVLASLQSKLSETLEEKRALKQRNQDLETDCADLQALIKEYEVVLEEVTSKLRNHANATTEGQLRLRREYEALLDAEKGTTAALFVENTMLQSQLLQLSQALRKLYSDETLDNHDQEMAQLQQENKDLRELLKISKIEDESSADRGSPVIHVARTGVVEEYFSSDQ